jgi:hypothetical protein
MEAAGDQHREHPSDEKDGGETQADGAMTKAVDHGDAPGPGGLMRAI